MARAKNPDEKAGTAPGEGPAESGPLPPATATAGAQFEAAAVIIPAAQPDARRPDAKGPAGWTVVVAGPPKGRWRIGRPFGPEPVSIPASDLTMAQVAALQGDPLLTVSVVEAPS